MNDPETDRPRLPATRGRPDPVRRKAATPKQPDGEIVAKPNWKNRTIWTRDNLCVMRGLNSSCVDLIYLDPPFNSNRNYEAPIGSNAASAAFKDAWTFDDADRVYLALLKERDPTTFAIIEAARLAHGKGMAAYLGMMAQRLVEMRRILKPSGAIYLHCDGHAGHYLKILMDAIFGAGNFRNAVTWRRAVSHNDAGRYGRISDYLLFYTMSDQYTWNDIRDKKDDDDLAKAYPRTDENGDRYRSDNMTGPARGTPKGESAKAWRGYDIASRGRVWSVPKKGTYADYIEAHFIPGYKSISGVHARLDALDAAGLIVHPKRGFWPGLKRYAKADEGKPVQDIIWEPTGLTNYSAKEWQGYPTQKPFALLEKLFRVSANEGDIILDPFCGCATACVVAEHLKLNWIGIDISEKALELVTIRLQEKIEELELYKDGDVIPRTDQPHRTDLEKLPPYRSHLDLLCGRQDGTCGGCGVRFHKRNLTVDHIVPRSHGGTDHIENLWLLCGACNSSKGARTQEEFLKERMQNRLELFPWLVN